MKLRLEASNPLTSPTLVAEWQALARAVPPTTPYSEPDFVVAAAAMAHQELTPLLITVRNIAGELVALLPVGLERRKIGPTRRDVIRAISPGRADLTALLSQPDVADQAAAAIAQQLARYCAAGIMVEVKVLDSTDALLANLAPPLRATVTSRYRAASLVGRANWQAVLNDGHRRREIQRAQRRLREQGGEVVWASSSNEARDFVARFVQLHTAQQQDRRRQFRFATVPARAALATLVSNWYTSDQADIALLSVAGADIAGYLLFHHRGATWAYRTAFDLSWSRMAPGIVILAAAIDRAIARGSASYQFSWGEQPYKIPWSEPTGSVHRLVGTPDRASAIPYRLLSRLLRSEGTAVPGPLARLPSPDAI